VSRYRCVDDQKAAGFPVTAACEVAGVSTSGYYDWQEREAAGPTERQVAEAQLVELMRAIYDAAEENYGVPRMHRELRRAGQVVNKKRVERLMRLHGMVGRHHRPRLRTTIPGPDGYRIPDLVGRRFDPGRPDTAWCQDITYIPTGEGWLFLASVLDLGSRRLLGYSMAEHMRTELVLDALEMAVAARGGDGAVHGVIVHADRGSQYTSNDYLDYCLDPHRQLRPSVGRTGVCWDNSGVVLVQSQARVHPRPRVPDPSRGPPGDLPVDQLVQHHEASQQPRPRPTHRVGTAAPSSFITTCPLNGGTPMSSSAGVLSCSRARPSG